MVPSRPATSKIEVAKPLLRRLADELARAAEGDPADAGLRYKVPAP